MLSYVVHKEMVRFLGQTFCMLLYDVHAHRKVCFCSLILYYQSDYCMQSYVVTSFTQAGQVSVFNEGGNQNFCMVFACHTLLFTVSVHYFLKIKLLWESFCLDILSFVNCSHKKFVCLFVFFWWWWLGGGGFVLLFGVLFLFLFLEGEGAIFGVVYTGKVSLGIGLFAYYYKLFT